MVPGHSGQARLAGLQLGEKRKWGSWSLGAGVRALGGFLNTMRKCWRALSRGKKTGLGMFIEAVWKDPNLGVNPGDKLPHDGNEGHGSQPLCQSCYKQVSLRDAVGTEDS